MSDSDNGTGTGSEQEEEEVLEFKCRKCPGRTFTAAEKDAHRMFHRGQKDKKKNRPGPKSKTRSTRRATSPAISEGTLFQPVESPSPDKTKKKKVGKRKNDRDEEDTGRAKKRRSKKNYDDTVIGGWANGTGA